MSFCKECGSALREQAQFCPVCGAPKKIQTDADLNFQSPVLQHSPELPKKNPKTARIVKKVLFAGVSSLLAVAILVSGIILVHHPNLSFEDFEGEITPYSAVVKFGVPSYISSSGDYVYEHCIKLYGYTIDYLEFDIDQEGICQYYISIWDTQTAKEINSIIKRNYEVEKGIKDGSYSFVINTGDLYHFSGISVSYTQAYECEQIIISSIQSSY